MFPTARCLASHPRNTLLKKPSLALLPPLQLYRRLLRTHRKKLPADMRVLGDEYVRAEFRLHRDVENPVHIVGFLTEWQLYAQALEGDTWRGVKLEKDKIEKMSDEQVGQLYELMRNIRGLDEGSGEGGKGSSGL
ncbi:acn9 family domain-containing protein [Tricharina praecox]|uniref:acn9 family domain-containing protein n=1 Tax=Tricharina praecox TaxID=43433 RepID=UPI00221F05C2|nr:acn9 family domain-containing protein [Tricharina praecox]KAI5842688.1 acn9 family domain-containing protein [Tricharina praecox]